jgi:hypothetical protein
MIDNGTEVDAMASKTYEQKTARLVQECLVHSSYMTCLRFVRDHMVAHPEKMPVQTRALAIVDARARAIERTST